MYAALYQNKFFVSFRSLNSDTAKFFFEAHYNEGTLESNLVNQQRCSALGPGIVSSENTQSNFKYFVSTAVQRRDLIIKLKQ
jgi:5-keto 4-deoxyuronate isomerase